MLKRGPSQSSRSSARGTKTTVTCVAMASKPVRREPRMPGGGGKVCASTRGACISRQFYHKGADFRKYVLTFRLSFALRRMMESEKAANIVVLDAYLWAKIPSIRGHQTPPSSALFTSEMQGRGWRSQFFSRIHPMQAQERYLPDPNRVGVLAAAVLLTYALTRLVNAPGFTLAIQLPGFYLSYPFTLGTAMTLMAAGPHRHGYGLVIGQPSLFARKKYARTLAASRADGVHCGCTARQSAARVSLVGWLCGRRRGFSSS